MDSKYSNRYKCSGCLATFHREDYASKHVSGCEHSARRKSKVVCLSEQPHWMKKTNRHKLIKPQRNDPVWMEFGYGGKARLTKA